MEELLIVAVQFLFELAFNVLVDLTFEWPFRNRNRPEPDAILVWCVVWYGLGCLIAGASLIVLSHSVISVPALRIVNLVASPVTAALLSKAIARRRARTNGFIVPRNHFWMAFWFTLGLALVRFAYAKHT